MSERKRDPRRSFGATEAFTIVEVLVAALVLALASFGVLGLISTATRGTYRAEESQVVVDRLQLEMEKIRNMPYAQVILSEQPQTSDDPENPGYRVSAARTRFALNKDGFNVADLVFVGGTAYPSGTLSCPAGATCLSPGPTPFTSGDVSGDVYRYVTWENDDGCSDTACPGPQDYKRVTVIATIDETAAGGVRAYQELQSDFIDPGAETVAGTTTTTTTPTSAPASSVISYSLSDTSCKSTYTDREPLANHALHNTLGQCAAGVTSGSTPGSPDRMWLGAGPAGLTSEFDYATDLEPAQSPENDRGLQIPVQDGCVYNPSGSHVHVKVHRWLTAPVTATSDFVIDSGSLKLYTKTINGATHKGAICVYLFTREVNVRGIEVDNLIADASASSRSYFLYSRAIWPKDAWTAVTVPMTFSSVRVAPGDRIGVAIAVDKDGTETGQVLQFMYGLTADDSQLSLSTTTPASAPT